MLQTALEEHKAALAAREQQVPFEPLSVWSSAVTPFLSSSEIDLKDGVMA